MTLIALVLVLGLGGAAVMMSGSDGGGGGKSGGGSSFSSGGGSSVSSGSEALKTAPKPIEHKPTVSTVAVNNISKILDDKSKVGNTKEEKLYNYINNSVSKAITTSEGFLGELKTFSTDDTKKEERDNILTEIIKGLKKIYEKKIVSGDTTNELQNIIGKLTKIIDKKPSEIKKEDYETELKNVKDGLKKVNKAILNKRDELRITIENDKLRKEQERKEKEKRDAELIKQAVEDERKRKIEEERQKKELDKKKKELEDKKKKQEEDLKKKKALEEKKKKEREDKKKAQDILNKKKAEADAKKKLEEKTKADKAKANQLAQQKQKEEEEKLKKKKELDKKKKELEEKKKKEQEEFQKKAEAERIKKKELDRVAKFSQIIDKCFDSKGVIDNSGVEKPIFDNNIKQQKNSLLKLNKEQLLKAISEFGQNLKTSGAKKTEQWEALCRLKDDVLEYYKDLEQGLPEELKNIIKNNFTENETEAYLSEDDKKMFDEFLNASINNIVATIQKDVNAVMKDLFKAKDSNEKKPLIKKMSALNALRNNVQQYKDSHPIKNENDAEKGAPIESNILKQNFVMANLPNSRKLPQDLDEGNQLYDNVRYAYQALERLEFEIGSSLQDFLYSDKFNECCENLKFIDTLYNTNEWQNSTADLKIYLDQLTQLFDGKSDYTLIVSKIFRIFCAVTGQRPIGDLSISDNFEDLMKYLNSDYGRNDRECIINILEKSPTLLNIAMGWLMLQDSQTFDKEVITEYPLVNYDDQYRFNSSAQDIDKKLDSILELQNSEAAKYLHLKWITELKAQGKTADEISKMTLEQLSERLKLKIDAQHENCSLTHDECINQIDNFEDYKVDKPEVQQLRSKINDKNVKGMRTTLGGLIFDAATKLYEMSREQIDAYYDLSRDVTPKKEEKFKQSVNINTIGYLKTQFENNDQVKSVKDVLKIYGSLQIALGINGQVTEGNVNDVIQKLSIPNDILNLVDPVRKISLLNEKFQQMDAAIKSAMSENAFEEDDSQSSKKIVEELDRLYRMNQFKFNEEKGKIERSAVRSPYEMLLNAMDETRTREIGSSIDQVRDYEKNRPNPLNEVREVLGHYLLSYEFREGVFDKKGNDETDNIFSEFKELRNHCINGGAWTKELFWDGLISYQNETLTEDSGNVREQTPTILLVQKYVSIRDYLKKFGEHNPPLISTLRNKTWNFVANFWGPIIGSFFGKASDKLELEAQKLAKEEQPRPGLALIMGLTPSNAIRNKTMFWGVTAAENWFRNHYKDSLVDDPLFQTTVFSYIKYRRCFYKKYDIPSEISEVYKQYKEYDFYKNGVSNNQQEAKNIQTFINAEKIYNADNLKDEDKFIDYCIGTSFDSKAKPTEDGALLKDLSITKDLKIDATTKQLKDIRQQFKEKSNEYKESFDNIRMQRVDGSFCESRRELWQSRLKSIPESNEIRNSNFFSSDIEKKEFYNKFKNVEWHDLLNQIRKYERALVEKNVETQNLLEQLNANRQKLRDYEKSLNDINDMTNLVNSNIYYQNQFTYIQWQQGQLETTNNTLATNITTLIQNNLPPVNLSDFQRNYIWGLQNTWSVQGKIEWRKRINDILACNFHFPVVKNQIEQILQTYDHNCKTLESFQQQLGLIANQTANNNNKYNEILTNFCQKNNINDFIKNNNYYLIPLINNYRQILVNLILQKRAECDENKLIELSNKLQSSNNVIYLLKENAKNTLSINTVNPEDAKWAKIIEPGDASEQVKLFYKTFKTVENGKHVFDVENDTALIGDMAKNENKNGMKGYLDYFVQQISEDDQIPDEDRNSKLRAIKKLVSELKKLPNMNGLVVDGLDNIPEVENNNNEHENNEHENNNDEVNDININPVDDVDNFQDYTQARTAVARAVDLNNANSADTIWKIIKDVHTRKQNLLTDWQKVFWNWGGTTCHINDGDGVSAFNFPDDAVIVTMCPEIDNIDQLVYYLGVSYKQAADKINTNNMNPEDESIQDDANAPEDVRRAAWKIDKIKHIVEELNSLISNNNASVPNGLKGQPISINKVKE